ncbi:MAG: CopG family transcriptional regulator [Thermoanaerobaculia bacterium]
MRTTLTLENELARRLKERAGREGRSFKEVVNETIRRGLGAQEVAESAEPYRVDTFRSGLRAGIDPLKLNQLGDELEADDR